GGLRDQAQGGGALCGGAGQIRFEGGRLEAAYTPPEIQLPGIEAEADLILAAVERLSAGVEIAGRQRAAAARLCRHGRKLFGALDAEGGAGLLDTQGGDAQVTIVGQGATDQILQ